MKKIDELHFRVVDKGLFLPIARRLAMEAGKVSYYTPWEKPFPMVQDMIGDGFEEIERVDSIFQDHRSVDCFVFPDTGFTHEQRELAAQGFPVWGPMGGDILETSRGRFLDALATTELPVPKHEKITGIDALREFLRDKQDRWIKISRFRGDCETFHWRSWEEDENALDHFAVRFGPFRSQIRFYVFDPIDASIEDGCDTYCVDGQIPSLVIHGMEAKDQAFIGTFQRFSDLPPELRIASEQFGPILGNYGYRSFFSTEVRITEEGESYFIDPTCRAGSPPHQSMTELIGNYADVIWSGARGICLDPEPVARFGIQVMVHAKPDTTLWTALKVNSKLDPWLKCSSCMREGNLIVFPHEPGGDIECKVWVVGIGNTIPDALDHLSGNIKLLPDGCCVNMEPLGEILSEIQEAESQGMEFTPQRVPKPEIVLDS